LFPKRLVAPAAFLTRIVLLGQKAAFMKPLTGYDRLIQQQTIAMRTAQCDLVSKTINMNNPKTIHNKRKFMSIGRAH
jgi:hypothetical protein